MSAADGQERVRGAVEDAESAARPKYCTHQGANTVQCVHGLFNSARYFTHGSVQPTVTYKGQNRKKFTGAKIGASFLASEPSRGP